MFEIKEECVFTEINNDGHYLYTRTYIPEKASFETAVVIVSPICRERLRIYREIVMLARNLARAGHPVICFDYRGEGESFGAFKDFDVNTRLEDIKFVVEYIKRKLAISNICLMGIHLGAVLAVLSAKDVSANKLILCDPVFEYNKYSKNLIRSNIILQQQYFNKITENEQALRQKLSDGHTINVYGFHLGKAILEQIENMDIIDSFKSFDGNISIIYFSNNTELYKKNLIKWKELFDGKTKTVLKDAAFSFSWATNKVWMPDIHEFTNVITNNLEG